DSTKSPAFVKTVPKRGYQFIATVERSAPLSSNDQPTTAEIAESDVEPILTFANTTLADEVITETIDPEPTAKAQENHVEVEPVTNQVKPKDESSNKW
ncbi:transcriptional regulator, partial [Vibrio sp. 10N.222.48.A3]